jgi:hypothetical protein
MDLMEIKWRLWTGFVWLKIGTSGALLWTRSWIFAFHKRRGTSWLVDDYQLLKKDSAPWSWIVICKGKVNGKVIPVLLIEHQAMKAYWGVEV